MAEQKEFAFVIFGASGFTGQFVVEELARQIAAKSGSQGHAWADKSNLPKWAVAGRSEKKIKEVLATAADRLKDASIKNVPIIIADVADQQSMNNLARRSAIVLNCVGPYRFFGEPVVRACVENGANYLDVSGEPEFVEQMAFKYNQQAIDKGVVIVSTCGFDSIPADIGTLFVQKLVKAPAVITGIESYLSLHSGAAGFTGHYATYESAVHGFGSAADLAKLRKKTDTSRLPVYGQPLKRYGSIFFNSTVGRYCMPFMGSDASVVRRSQRYFHEHKELTPVQYSAYFTLPGKKAAFLFILFGTIFSLFARFQLGRKILLKFPRLFSYGLFTHDGPTLEQMRTTTFSKTFFAHGYKQLPEVGSRAKPDIRVTVKVAGPEPGYVLTPIVLVQAAFALHEERDRLPNKSGVLTPAVALYGSTIIDRLKSHGLEMSVVKSEGL